jgi:hypothetical protein
MSVIFMVINYPISKGENPLSVDITPTGFCHSIGLKMFSPLFPHEQTDWPEAFRLAKNTPKYAPPACNPGK